MTIDNYNEILINHETKYSKKLSELKNKYSISGDSLSLREKIEINRGYNNLVIKLIKSIIVDINKYEKLDFGVFLSGSLARKSNTLFSDIDINYIITNDINYLKMIEVEDKINYIIKTILKFRGKDRIHSMVVYMPLKKNEIYDKVTINKYPLNFADGIIYDKCRKNAEKLMYETYNSTRNLYDVIDYYNKHDNDNCVHEWLYCTRFIYNNKIKNIFNSLRKINKNPVNIKLKEKIIKDIYQDFNFVDCKSSKIKICDLKKTYKSKIYKNFYNILAIEFKNNINLKKFNIESLYNHCKKIRFLIILFYKYQTYVEKLESILDSLNLDLSSHDEDYIFINEINKENILKKLNITKEYFYNECINYLEENIINEK